MTPVDEVITFWFGELQPVQWWRADPGLDRFIRERFGPLHARAERGELMNWRGTALGRLCLLYTSPSPRDAHESRMPSSA